MSNYFIDLYFRLTYIHNRFPNLIEYHWTHRWAPPFGKENHMQKLVCALIRQIRNKLSYGNPKNYYIVFSFLYSPQLPHQIENQICKNLSEILKENVYIIQHANYMRREYYHIEMTTKIHNYPVNTTLYLQDNSELTLKNLIHFM